MLFSHLIQTVCHEDKIQGKSLFEIPSPLQKPVPSHNFILTELFATILETGKRNLCRKYPICVFLRDHQALHPTPNKLQLLQGDHPTGDTDLKQRTEELDSSSQALKPFFALGYEC